MTDIQERESRVPALSGPRLPYHPAIQERFGVDKSGWKALVEAIFPTAEKVESVIMVLSYCKARNLDPFKRVVHIVPIWSQEKRCMVDTVWPGIGELRTTAFRTKAYAGMDEVAFGPDVTRTWMHKPKSGPEQEITVTFAEWCQVTVYRMVQGQRVPFPGPRVYWMETYAKMGRFSDAPNSMWQTRPRGQHMKCGEAAALRAAFPEEIGDEFAAEEARVIQDSYDTNAARQVTAEPEEEPAPRQLPPKGLDDLADALKSKAAVAEPEPETTEAPESKREPGETPSPPSASFFDEEDDDATGRHVEPEPGS